LIAARAVQSVPDIVGKLVLRFPFLDINTAMSDPSQPLFSEEKEEWGYDSEGRGTGLAPLDLRGSPSFCDVFITVAGKDRRAPSWHAANYVASILNEEKVFVNFLEDADHTGFEEDADTVETNFILGHDRFKSLSLWNRLKESLFSK
jgi:protease II